MSLLDAINIGASGLEVHGERVKLAARNIANADTPNYVRKIPVLIAKEDISFQGLLNNMKSNVFSTGVLPVTSGGVSMAGLVYDPTPGDLMYSPGHPDADKNGYIRKSNVNPLVEIADANMSSRAYEASIAVISLTKQMAQKATEIGK